MIRVREDGAKRHRAGAWVDANFRERELSLPSISSAILQGQVDGWRIVAAGIQILALQSATHGEKIGAGLGDVDVDRIKLHHRCKRLALVRCHKRPLCHGRAADPARDRREHLGVGQIDRGVVQRGLVHLDVSRSLTRRGSRLIVAVLADPAFLSEGALTSGMGAGVNEGSLVVEQGAFGLVISRLIGCRVNLI